MVKAHQVSEQPGLPEGLAPGDPGYRRAVVAVLFAGIASFQALYATQALLPVFAADFNVDPATAALTVSATTGGLACAVIPVSVLSERFGRRRVMVTSALLATVLGLLISMLPGIGFIIAVRLLQGLILAGVPAVAMAYVSEEIHQDHIGRVMGLYVAGTTIGGLMGRIIPSLLLEIFNWHIANFISATVAVICAIGTWWLLPQQRRFQPKKLSIAGELKAIKTHLGDFRILGLCVMAFMFMGAFVSLYNYLGFRLTDKFGLSPGLAGFVFILYLSGTWGSARAGVWVKTVSRRQLIAIATAVACLGLILVALPSLIALVLGVLLFTASFFVAHSLSSSGVGLVAQHDRAEAASMYLFSYYMGSSILGWVSGFVFNGFGWAVLIPWLIGLSLIAGTCAIWGLKDAEH